MPGWLLQACLGMRSADAEVRTKRSFDTLITAGPPGDWSSSTLCGMHQEQRNMGALT